MSKFFAWLLDANGGHDFGDVFLKEFLCQVIEQEDPPEASQLPSLAEISVADFSQLRVYVEDTYRTRRYDIVLTAEECILNHGFFCLIENKIGSHERKDQTSGYYKTSLEKYPIEKYPIRMYILLAPDKMEPQDHHFTSVPYQRILAVINKVTESCSFSQKDQFLLDQFEESIMKMIVPDKRMVDLAQAIYEQHKETFQFIYDNVEFDGDSVDDSMWDGKSWFFNIGENTQGTGYSWEDSYINSFICAGGAKRYRSIMEKFKIGDIIYAYVSGCGYVGIGEVLNKAEPFRNASLPGGKTLMQLRPVLRGVYNAGDDDNTCDWVVPVRWELKVPKTLAVKELPITRQTACRIYDERKELVESIRSALLNNSSS